MTPRRGRRGVRATRASASPGKDPTAPSCSPGWAFRIATPAGYRHAHALRRSRSTAPVPAHRCLRPGGRSRAARRRARRRLHRPDAHRRTGTRLRPDRVRLRPRGGLRSGDPAARHRGVGGDPRAELPQPARHRPRHGAALRARGRGPVRGDPADARNAGQRRADDGLRGAAGAPRGGGGGARRPVRAARRRGAALHRGRQRRSRCSS